MSTATCKEYIKTISKQYYLDPKSTWKRISKKTYPISQTQARRFKNEFGDEVTINELVDNRCFLTDLAYSSNASITPELLSTLNYEKLVTELIKMALTISPDLDDDVVERMFNRLWSPTETHRNIANQNFNNLKNIKRFKFEELGWELYATLSFNNEDRLDYNDWPLNFCDDIHHDNVNMVYDAENFTFTVKTYKEIAYIEMCAGGDWEYPIILYAYWSAKENRIKGFLPRGTGNVYNMETGTAYGSELDRLNSDDYNEDAWDILKSEYENAREKLEYDELYKKASVEGLKQLQKHIIREYQNN